MKQGKLKLNFIITLISYFLSSFAYASITDSIEEKCNNHLNTHLSGFLDSPDPIGIHITMSIREDEDGIRSASASCWFYGQQDPSTSPFEDGRRGFALYSPGVGLGEIEKPKNKSKCKAGNPVTISTGEKIQTEILFTLKNSIIPSFDLVYTSSNGRWTHSLDYKASMAGKYVTAPSGYTYQTPKHWINAGSQKLSWYKKGTIQYKSDRQDYTVQINRPDGTGYKFDYINGKWVDVWGKSGELEWLGDLHDGWKLILGDTTEYYSASGKLTRIENSIGQYIDLSYSGSVITITDQNSRIYSVSTNSGLRLNNVKDPAGNTFSLTFSGPLLETISYPDDTPLDASDNPTKQFLYEDENSKALLTGIIDQNNVRYATWEYDSDKRAIFSEHAYGAERVEFNYPDDFTTEVTNALGKKTTYHFGVVPTIKYGLTRKLTRVEGHASSNCLASNKSITYNPEGRPFEVTNQNGSVTRYEYNDRGLEIKRIEALGTNNERSITTSWHSEKNLPVRIVEPMKETIYQYDGNGKMVSQRVNAR